MSSQRDKDKPLIEGSVAPPEGAEDEEEIAVVETDALGKIVEPRLDIPEESEGEDVSTESFNTASPPLQGSVPDPDSVDLVVLKGDNPNEPIDWKNSNVRRGYELLEAIIHERHASILRAIASNVRRHGWRGRVPDLAAAGTFFWAGMAVGHPVFGMLLAGGSALARSLAEVIRIRHDTHESQAVKEVRLFLLTTAVKLSEDAAAVRVDTVPRVAEFHILWVRHAWRLVHCIKGYNTRLEAAKLCFQAPNRTVEQEMAANRILTLLGWIRPQLIHAMQALEDLYLAELASTKGNLYDLQRSNDRVQKIDPFQEKRKDLPGLEWLPLPYEKLARVELPAQAEEDTVAWEASQELYVQDIDRKFVDLETEHGADVDRMREQLRRVEEDKLQKAKAETRAAADKRWKASKIPESDDE
jgi:hypothetical protein